MGPREPSNFDGTWDEHQCYVEDEPSDGSIEDALAELEGED